jgi:hypothetical protein
MVNEVTQAELIASKISTTPGTYSVTVSAKLDNNQLVKMGNSSGQDTELDAGDSIDVPGDALGDIYVKGTPTGFDITDVIQGSKLFKFLGDQSDRIVAGDKISIVGSTGNDGFYTVVDATFATGKTTVEVSEAIPNATADGDLFHADKIILFARG